MPTLQALKKKLKGVRSIEKFAKAMKNISTMKFSRLNARFAAYSEYASQQRRLYENCRSSYDEYRAAAGVGAERNAAKDAPAALVVIASNRGLCGDFNRRLLSFAEERIAAAGKPCTVYLCGKKAEAWFREKGLPYERAFAVSDIPEYGEMRELLGCLKAGLESGGISGVWLVFSRYVNMLQQTPVLRDFRAVPDDSDGSEVGEDSAAEREGEGGEDSAAEREGEGGEGGAAEREDEASGAKEETETLFVPDKQSFIKNTADEIPAAFLYGALLESALGAQAATLMTMRSAYDTATEYRAALESEINRKRQGKVTADVIESSADRPREEEN